MPTRTIEEELLAIVCQDTDLLHAEFDAIIAASWPAPTNTPPQRPQRRPWWPPGGWLPPRQVPGPIDQDGGPVPDRPARQRSPPRTGKAGDE